MDNQKSFKPSDLKLMIRLLIRRKWMIIIPWVIVSGLAIGGSYMIPPEYQAATIVSIDTEINLSPQMRQQVSVGNRNTWNVNYAERLRSYRNELTSSLYLTQLDEATGFTKTPEISAQIDAELATRPNLTRQQVAANVLVSELKERIDVQFAGEDQLRIAISSQSPTMARDQANGLAEIFIEENHIQRINSSRLHGDFSDTQLEKFENKLQDAIVAKTNFESHLTENRLPDAVVQTDNLSDIAAEIFSLEQDVDRYRDREKQLLAQLQSNDDRRVATPRLDESERIETLNAGWHEELNRISDLVMTHAWGSSPIQSLKVRLNSYMTDIEEENAKLVNRQYDDQDEETRNLLTLLFNSRTNLNFYRSRATAMMAAQDDLTARINRIPEDRSRLDQLEQEIVSATRSRDRWKQEQETSAISQDLYKDFRFRVIEPARVPVTPFKPNKLQIGIFGILIGLVIGGAAVVVVELMDNSFKRVEEIPEELGLPVLGIAPRMPFLKKVGR